MKNTTKKTPKHPTIAVQADIWLAQAISRKRKPLRAKTAENYKCMIEKHIKPLVGKVSLDVVGNRTLKDIVALLTEKKLSAGSILLIVNILKMIVASATDQDGQEIYPRTWNSEFIDMPVITDQKRPIASAQSVQDGLSRLSGYPKALLAVLAGSGLRISEALAITTGSDDGLGNFWNGEKIIVRAQRKGSTLVPTKTAAGLREVDLAPALNEYLKQNVQPQISGYMFEGSESHYRYNLEGVGIEGGFHSLRRFRVTHLRLQGIPDALIHFWVGHEDETVTDAYTMVGPEIAKRKTFAEQAGLGFKLEAQ